LYDLRRFYEFLREKNLTVETFTRAHGPEFLAYLSEIKPRNGRRSISYPHLAGYLSPATVNRMVAAVSTFYEHLVLIATPGIATNPLAATDNRRASGRRRYMRDLLRLKRVDRIHRPLSDKQVQVLLETTRSLRNRAMLLLMLQGGLRPGEVLNLHLDDIQYGRRRIFIRHRTDHPKGVRTKSRTERAVDLLQPEALESVSQYVMHERPSGGRTELVFLVGGSGKRSTEPLGYYALAKLFKRACLKAGLVADWITPHALRHTHATMLWEGGMRELALQKRLGHLSFESTRAYTRVSDAAMLADYQKALAALERRATDGSRT
jgi:integrase